MTEQKKLQGILIDARTKSISEVTVGEYPHWKKTIECDDINAVNLQRYSDGFTETLWVDGEGLLNDKQNGPWFKLMQYPQPMAVIGIILGTDEQGETVNTRWTVQDVEPMVTWPNVHFEGLRNIEPGFQQHPVLGNVFVTGTEPVFTDMAEFEAETEKAADEDDESRRDI
jgi:hypothetical protein